MRPFNNVAVSATEPKNKNDVWIKHSKNLCDKNFLEEGNINPENGKDLVSDNSVRSKYITVIPEEPYALNIKLNKEITVAGVHEYNENKEYIEYKAMDETNPLNPKLIFTTNENTAYIRFKVGVPGGFALENIETVMLEEGKNYTDYEPYIEDDILVKENQEYKSILNQAEEYDITEESTYVNAKSISWCNVINKVAHVSLTFNPKEIQMGAGEYKMFSGLPKPKSGFSSFGVLIRGTESNLPIRFLIKSDGTLNYWYNPSVALKTNHIIVIDLTYPIS